MHWPLRARLRLPIYQRQLWTNHSCFVSIFERGMSRLDLNGHEHSTAKGIPFTCSSERSVVSLPQTDEKCILETVLLTVICLTSISKLLYLHWDACTCLLVKKNNWNKRLRWIRLHIDLVFWLAWKSLPCTSTSPPCSLQLLLWHLLTYDVMTKAESYWNTS